MTAHIDYRARWEQALTLEQFIATAEASVELWKSMSARATAPAELTERVSRLPAPRRLLVLLEDWCGDAVNTIPLVDALVAAVPQLELRVLARDENPDLMDAHLSPTGARAIPVVIVLDEHYRERGWWGPRPTPLQEWTTSPEARSMDPRDRYREIRRWYARDHGRTSLREIVELLESTSTDAPARAA